MSYTPPANNAVNFNDTNGAYSVPANNAVNFNDVSTPTDIVSAGIASAEAIGQPDVGLTVVSAGIAGAEATGSPDVGLTIVGAGIASEEAVGAPVIGLTALPVVDTSDQVSGVHGGYGSVRQRTNVYAADARNGQRVSYRITADNITADRPADNEDVDAQDRRDLRDIFTAFRELRKAA